MEPPEIPDTTRIQVEKEEEGLDIKEEVNLQSIPEVDLNNANGEKRNKRPIISSSGGQSSSPSTVSTSPAKTFSSTVASIASNGCLPEAVVPERGKDLENSNEVGTSYNNSNEVGTSFNNSNEMEAAEISEPCQKTTSLVPSYEVPLYNQPTTSNKVHQAFSNSALHRGQYIPTIENGNNQTHINLHPPAEVCHYVSPVHGSNDTLSIYGNLNQPFYHGNVPCGEYNQPITATENSPSHGNINHSIVHGQLVQPRASAIGSFSSITSNHAHPNTSRLPPYNSDYRPSEPSGFDYPSQAQPEPSLYLRISNAILGYSNHHLPPPPQYPIYPDNFAPDQPATPPQYQGGAYNNQPEWQPTSYDENPSLLPLLPVNNYPPLPGEMGPPNCPPLHGEPPDYYPEMGPPSYFSPLHREQRRAYYDPTVNQNRYPTYDIPMRNLLKRSGGNSPYARNFGSDTLGIPSNYPEQPPTTMASSSPYQDPPALPTYVERIESRPASLGPPVVPLLHADVETALRNQDLAMLIYLVKRAHDAGDIVSMKRAEVHVAYYLSDHDKVQNILEHNIFPERYLKELQNLWLALQYTMEFPGILHPKRFSAAFKDRHPFPEGLTNVSVQILNAAFAADAVPSTQIRKELAKRIGQTAKQVDTWFRQKRRSRKKEVDGRGKGRKRTC